MSVMIEVALIVLGGLTAGFCLVVLAVRLPPNHPVFEPGLRPGVRTVVWPAQLVRLERIVASSAASGWDVHTGLRPVLVEIVETRLARRGLGLDRDAAEVQRLLGPAAWELVRPDRPPPRDPDSRGIPPNELEAILDAVEAL